jgi:HlyD family secretion protein
MRRLRLFIVATVAVIINTACTKPESGVYNGYAEGDYVRMASPIGGTLKTMYLKRGGFVQANAPAFVLEQDAERAAETEARSRVEQAKAQAANLKLGKRPDELAAIQAQLAQAEAAAQLSSATLARQQRLVADKFLSPASLDEARASVARDLNRVRELNAQLRVARTGARPDEIAAAQDQVKATDAQLAQAAWRVAQKAQRTPVAGDVIDVLYREGEWVPAGSPVVQLLPPANVKARFFVPQAVLGELKLGQSVTITCDGCGEAIPAMLSFITREAEFTSPIIYSKENRASLVYMIEAQPDAAHAQRLHPGQPIEVRLHATGAANKTP